MKNGVYLSLGLVLVINRSANGVDDGNPYCKYDNNTYSAQCYHKPDIATSNPDLYKRMDDLSTDVMNLTLQTIHSPEWKWRISSADQFKRYRSLFALQIFGVVSFGSESDTNYTRMELFNLPNLRTLSLFYNGFNSIDHLWRLPSLLTSITVVGNDYVEFSLTEATKLKEIFFHQTALTSLPELANPPPPLRTVDFRQNSLMEVDVENVASFCQATNLSFDAKNLKSPDKYCECIKMKRWINEILKQSEESIFSEPLNCLNSSSQDCQDDNLNAALRNRETCLSQPLDVAVLTKSGPFSSVLLYIGIGVAFITVLGLISLLTYSLYSTNQIPTPPHFEPEKVDHDRMDDDDDTRDGYVSDEERDDAHEHGAEVVYDEEFIETHK